MKLRIFKQNNELCSGLVEWDAVDIRYMGKGIEVKSAAYIQNWKQKTPSVIRFDISKKKSWVAETNTFINESLRNSDCFVFCLYTEKDKEKADILNTGKWEFYVVPTAVINKEFAEQKSVGLVKIQELCTLVLYDSLKSRIDKAMY